jgi:hypothetical protein
VAQNSVAGVMFGKNNSVHQLLQKDIPHIFAITCVCHSFAIVASNACKELPRFVEDAVRDIYNYVKCSTKRMLSLKHFQELCDLHPRKMLKRAQTRWLSLEAAVKRVLEQFDALVLFFEEEVKEEKLLAPQNILSWLKDPQMKICLQFLEFILPFFNKLNKLFQGETVLIHRVYSDILLIYKDIVACYIKPEFIPNVETMYPGNPDCFLPLQHIYVGANASISLTALNRSNPAAVHHLRTRFLNFLVTAAKELKRKFNFVGTGESILKDISLLCPQNILTNNSLTPLLTHFSILHPNEIQNIDSEYRSLRNYNNNGLDFENNSFEEFWMNVSKLMFGNEIRFPNLLNFISSYIFILPHASANVERVFSLINNNKCNGRSGLKTNSLIGILHTKELTKNKTCYSLSITQNMKEKFNVSMYDFKREETSSVDSDSE